MPLSARSKHGAVHQWQVPGLSSPDHAQPDYRQLLIRKMSELNTSANNQHQLTAGLAAYENFCANDNAMQLNSAKQSSHGQLRSRQMNGGDSPLIPSSPGSWQDNQQTVQSLRQELDERKRNEAQLHQMVRMLKQQQVAFTVGEFDPMNGPSLTPDGLPAAPSSDGILESVKDGHIRRLGRELTMLKAKLHEAETRFVTAQRERDSAFQQVASLSSLLADSDRRATNLQQQLSIMVGGGEKVGTLNETLEKQRAEISTLKESVLRLNRENQSLKEGAAALSSRQPSSLGTSGGSSSVAGCSQELDYLHKVVDTLKATVQEQHAKLCSLRSLHDKRSLPSSTVSGSPRAQSFPVTSSSSSRTVTASMAGSVRRRERAAVSTLDNSEWSVDGSVNHQEGLSGAAAVVPSTTAVLPNNNNLSSSSRSNQAVQDDETVNTLGYVMQKLKLSDTVLGGSAGGISAVENQGYFLAPQNNFNSASQGKLNKASSDSSTSLANNSRSQSQVLAPRRTDIPTTAAAVPSSSGSRPLSKSEVIGVSSGLGRPAITRSSSTHVASGALSKAASAQDMLAALSGRSDAPLNPAAVSTSVAGGVAASNLLAPRIVGSVASPAALQMSRHAQPQFVFEAEVEDGSGKCSTAGGTNIQQQLLGNYQQPRLPPPPPPASSSSVFTPQPPLPHQVRTSSSSPLSTYQTASAAVTSDREGMHVLNKHMMGGGNMIYQQSPQMLQPQQIQLGVRPALPPASQNLTFTAQALSPHGSEQQQQQLPLVYPATISSPLSPQQTVYSNTLQPGHGQQLDPSGPRVHSDRACPVCGQDFSHVPMEDFQAHVYECFDEAGPETMKAPAEERSSSGNGTVSASDRLCPVCNTRFEVAVPQAEFERHVHSHFGEENFEIVS